MNLAIPKYNFADIPVWDKLFGTYKDTDEFAEQCGFPNNNERKIWKIVLFRDVYDETDGLSSPRN